MSLTPAGNTLLYEMNLFSRSNTVTLAAFPFEGVGPVAADRRIVAECEVAAGTKGGETITIDPPCVLMLAFGPGD